MDEKIVKDSQGLAKDLVNDCISRQAAIDEIVAWTVEDRPDIEMPTDLVGRINALPSAQPEPIRLHVDHAFTEEEIKNLKQKISDSPIVFIPSAEKPFKLPEIYVADGYDTVADEDGNVGFGVYVPDENQIYVAGDVEDEIRAKALLHELCHWVQAMCGRSFDEDEANEFSDIVYDALPSAQPERKRGKWVFYEDRAPVWDIAGEKTWARAYKCSECGFVHSVIEDFGQYAFCPNCGADMREDDHETD